MKKDEDLYFGNLLAAKFPVLRKPWNIETSQIFSIRRRTTELRLKIQEGISKMFKDHLDDLERKGTTDYVTMTDVTDEHVREIDELIQEYKNEVGKKNLSEKKIFSASVIATIGGTIIALPFTVGFPLLSNIAFEITKDAIIGFSAWALSRQVTNPLHDVIMFIDEIDRTL